MNVFVIFLFMYRKLFIFKLISNVLVLQSVRIVSIYLPLPISVYLLLDFWFIPQISPLHIFEVFELQSIFQRILETSKMENLRDELWKMNEHFVRNLSI